MVGSTTAAQTFYIKATLFAPHKYESRFLQIRYRFEFVSISEYLKQYKQPRAFTRLQQRIHTHKLSSMVYWVGQKTDTHLVFELPLLLDALYLQFLFFIAYYIHFPLNNFVLRSPM